MKFQLLPTDSRRLAQSVAISLLSCCAMATLAVASPPATKGRRARGYGCEIRLPGKAASWEREYQTRKTCKIAGGRWLKIPTSGANTTKSSDLPQLPQDLPKAPPSSKTDEPALPASVSAPPLPQKSAAPDFAPQE